MHIIRSGVDSIYLAIKGTLPTEVLSAIQSAKTQAGTERRPITVELSDARIVVSVNPHGAKGGYAFTWDTGPLGAIWSCREAAACPDWNFFVKPHASALLAHGFAESVRAVLAFIPTLGGTVVEHAVNRIDYAVDIRADDFELELENFVTHPRAKRTPHWQCSTESTPSAVFAGRRLESATIGKMPGRQVSVYDKTAEVRAKGNRFWFEAWRIAPGSKAARVWRAELRLGKRELKERQKITTIGQLNRTLPAALSELIASTRYLASNQHDPNISRRKSHEIWQLLNDHIRSTDLLAGAGDISPERVIEISLEQRRENHRALMIGNAVSLAAMMDLNDAAIAARLPAVAATAINAAVGTDRFQRALSRARARRRALDS